MMLLWDSFSLQPNLIDLEARAVARRPLHLPRDGAAMASAGSGIAGAKRTGTSLTGRDGNPPDRFSSGLHF